MILLEITLAGQTVLSVYPCINAELYMYQSICGTVRETSILEESSEGERA